MKSAIVRHTIIPVRGDCVTYLRVYVSARLEKSMTALTYGAWQTVPFTVHGRPSTPSPQYALSNDVNHREIDK